MRVRVRLSLLAIAFLVPGLVLARWLSGGGLEGAPLSLPVLSESLGPWKMAAERSMADSDVALLQPDAYFVRRYEAPGRTPIWAYVAMYASRAAYGKGAHDPEVCYPAQGWEIVGSRSVELPLSNQETLRVKLLDAQQSRSQQAVLYWFQPAQRWPASAAVEQLVRVFDALAGRPQYAFVRLSAPRGQGPAAARDLAEFATHISWPVRVAVSGGLEREAPGTEGAASIP
jgi:EpsI family protein